MHIRWLWEICVCVCVFCCVFGFNILGMSPFINIIFRSFVNSSKRLSLTNLFIVGQFFTNLSEISIWGLTQIWETIHNIFFLHSYFINHLCMLLIGGMDNEYLFFLHHKSCYQISPVLLAFLFIILVPSGFDHIMFIFTFNYNKSTSKKRVSFRTPLYDYTVPFFL